MFPSPFPSATSSPNPVSALGLFRRMFVFLLGAPALAVVAATATDVGAQDAPKLAPPVTAKALTKVAAIGVQIYKCTSTDNKLSWTFVAPEADLFDASGKLVGKHGAGPFWEMMDGSKVNGMVAAREPSTRPGAIPHLLLSTTSTGSAGAAGTSIAKVKFIQRLNTLGGVAPATCTQADVDKTIRVYYTADYVLFTDS
jgi:Protein of unknown function (DUF3455)